MVYFILMLEKNKNEFKKHQLLIDKKIGIDQIF